MCRMKGLGTYLDLPPPICTPSFVKDTDPALRVPVCPLRSVTHHVAENGIGEEFLDALNRVAIVHLNLFDDGLPIIVKNIPVKFHTLAEPLWTLSWECIDFFKEALLGRK